MRERTERVVEGIPVRDNGRSFNLNFNNIGSEEFKNLIERLENNTLVSLNLWGGNIGSEKNNQIVNALKINTTLINLKLSNNNINDLGATCMAAMLEKNVFLKSLRYGHNALTAISGLALAKTLRVNATLVSLDLAYNSIGDEGAIALAAALKINSTLKLLNLLSNTIGEKGAIGLAEGLASNKTLTYLNLEMNRIGRGVVALAKTLATHTSLTTLVIGFNNIGAEGVAVLVRALKVNTCLKTLNLMDGASSIKAILNLFNWNTTITYCLIHKEKKITRDITTLETRNRKIALLSETALHALEQIPNNSSLVKLLAKITDMNILLNKKTAEIRQYCLRASQLQKIEMAWIEKQLELKLNYPAFFDLKQLAKTFQQLPAHYRALPRSQKILETLVLTYYGEGLLGEEIIALFLQIKNRDNAINSLFAKCLGHYYQLTNGKIPCNFTLDDAMNALWLKGSSFFKTAHFTGAITDQIIQMLIGHFLVRKVKSKQDYSKALALLQIVKPSQTRDNLWVLIRKELPNEKIYYNSSNSFFSGKRDAGEEKVGFTDAAKLGLNRHKS